MPPDLLPQVVIGERCSQGAIRAVSLSVVIKVMVMAVVRVAVWAAVRFLIYVGCPTAKKTPNLLSVLVAAWVTVRFVV